MKNVLLLISCCLSFCSETKATTASFEEPQSSQLFNRVDDILNFHGNPNVYTIFFEQEPCSTEKKLAWLNCFLFFPKK